MKKGLLIRLLAVAALLTLVIAMGCIRSSERERGGKGEIIHVGAYEPVKLDRVVYTLDGKNYVIAPQQEGNVIAAVRARVLNPESTQVTLSVDENAATLRDLNDTQYKLIDPSPGKGAVETQEEAPEENPYAARLWGEFQVVAGFEIPGWLFFETPETLDFSALVWEDVEFVRVRYPKKN